MDFSFPWPTSNGEWGAFGSAAATFLTGLLFFLAPRLGLRMLRLQPIPEKPEAVGEGRASLSGFYLGVGGCCILLAQPMLYIALGVSWLFAVFGRILAMMSDNANTPYNWAATVLELVLAGLPLAYAFGFLP